MDKSLSDGLSWKPSLARVIVEDEEFYRLQPANKTDPLCQSYNSRAIVRTMCWQHQGDSSVRLNNHLVVVYARCTSVVFVGRGGGAG